MVRRGGRQVRLAMVVAAVAVVASACGSGSGGRATSGAPTTTAVSRAASPHLRPPGSPIEDGLMVPEGAHLAGTAFHLVEVPARDVAADAGWTPWEAVLPIDGDPFAAWDDLAAQIRTTTSAPFAGSADACTWTRGPRESGGGAPSAAQAIVARSAPTEDVTGVGCNAEVSWRQGARLRSLSVALSAEVDRPATLVVRAEPSLRGTPSSTGWAMTIENGPKAGPPDRSPTAERVPKERSGQLPDLPAQPTPKVGEPFGSSVNCFARSADTDRLTVPGGASFVAQAGFGDTDVVAVEDADAALAAFRKQVEGPTPDPSSEPSTQHRTLADGRTITEYSQSISAGGGGCTFLTSPDGRYLLIGLYAD